MSARRKNVCGEFDRKWVFLKLYRLLIIRNPTIRHPPITAKIFSLIRCIFNLHSNETTYGIKSTGPLKCAIAEVYCKCNNHCNCHILRRFYSSPFVCALIIITPNDALFFPSLTEPKIATDWIPKPEESDGCHLPSSSMFFSKKYSSLSSSLCRTAPWLSRKTKATFRSPPRKTWHGFNRLCTRNKPELNRWESCHSQI